MTTIAHIDQFQCHSLERLMRLMSVWIVSTTKHHPIRQIDPSQPNPNIFQLYLTITSSVRTGNPPHTHRHKRHTLAPHLDQTQPFPCFLAANKVASLKTRYPQIQCLSIQSLNKLERMVNSQVEKHPQIIQNSTVTIVGIKHVCIYRHIYYHQYHCYYFYYCNHIYIYTYHR